MDVGHYGKPVKRVWYECNVGEIKCGQIHPVKRCSFAHKAMSMSINILVSLKFSAHIRQCFNRIFYCFFFFKKKRIILGIIINI